jgi:lysophospholipase L1-like esterase
MSAIIQMFSLFFLFISYSALAVSLPYTNHFNAPVSSDVIDALPAGLKLRILPLGDSITYGIGSTGSNSYRADLYKKLTAAGAAVDFIGSKRSGNFAQPNHEGWSGYTITQISSMSERSLPKKPNVVLLMAGTNDMPRGDAKGASSKLGTLIDKLVTAVPDSVVLVATLTPLGMAQAAVDTFNREVPIVVKSRADNGKKVAVVSFAAVKKTDLADGVHPNDAGYAKMADAWFKGVEDAAAKGWIKNPVAI